MVKLNHLSFIALIWLLMQYSFSVSQPIPKLSRSNNLHGTTLNSSGKKSYKTQLQAEIIEMNKALPIETQAGITASKYSYDGKNVVLKMTCDENMISIDLFNQRKEQIHDALVVNYRNDDDVSATSLFVLLTKNNAGFEVRYVGKTSGKFCSVILTPQEVRQIMSVKNSEKNPRQVVEQLVMLENENYPAEVADGLIVVGGMVEDFYVVYEASVDEDIYSISVMNQNKEKIKKEILSGFDFEDLATQTFFNNLIKARLGVEYRYIGDVTGEICKVKISVAEIRSLIDVVVAE